jgi:hypothetical protein
MLDREMKEEVDLRAEKRALGGLVAGRGPPAPLPIAL